MGHGRYIVRAPLLALSFGRIYALSGIRADAGQGSRRLWAWTWSLHWSLLGFYSGFGSGQEWVVVKVPQGGLMPGSQMTDTLVQDSLFCEIPP